jgi:hypothetical protein
VGVRKWEYGEGTVEEHSGQRRVPLREAARLLDISKDAVRQRIRRGTLRSAKGGDGRVYVYLNAASDAVHYDHDQEHDQRSHQPMPYEKTNPAELVDELRDRIRYLERQVEEERNARYRADELLAQLMQRVPQIEAPREEPRESPESAADEQQGRGPVPDVEGAQEPTRRPQEERRGLWQRLFGG